MPAFLEPLLALLDVRQVDDRTFLGPASHERHVRAFGGQVAAQALVAAGRTVAPGRPPHSLHSYFLRPGSPDDPIAYRVVRTRDGRSFSTRSVEAVQRDVPIFELTASFHDDEPGVEHSGTMPDTTPPDLLPSFEQRYAGREEDLERWFHRARPFDLRYVDSTPFDPPSPPHPARQQVWVKTAGILGDDPLVHRAVFTYASDMTVLDAILLHHGVRWTDQAVIGASLDHALWFHQPFRADEWLLLDQESPVAHGGRGLARGDVWTTDGRLVATVAQEALLRPPGKRPETSAAGHSA